MTTVRLVACLLLLLLGLRPLRTWDTDFAEAFGVSASLAAHRPPQAPDRWIVAGGGLHPGTSFPSPLPPSLGALLLPLLPLGGQMAAATWLALEVAALLATVPLALALLGGQSPVWLTIGGAGLLALTSGVSGDLHANPFTLLQLALVLGSWLLVREGRPFIAGLALALAPLIRPNAEVLCLATWPLARRDGRMLGGMALAVLALGGIPVALAGWDAWRLWPSGLPAARALWGDGGVGGVLGVALMVAAPAVALAAALGARDDEGRLLALGAVGCVVASLTWHLYEPLLTVPLLAASRIALRPRGAMRAVGAVG